LLPFPTAVFAVMSFRSVWQAVLNILIHCY